MLSLFGVELPEVSPHGMCLANFDPTLVWLTTLGDLMIFLAYCAGIPWASFRIAPFVAKHMQWVFWTCAAFVYLCGGSHLFDVLVIRRATYELYYLLAMERLATGVVSWAAVYLLYRTVQSPKVKLVVDE